MSILEKLSKVSDVRDYLPAMLEDNKVNVAKARMVLGYGPERCLS